LAELDFSELRAFQEQVIASARPRLERILGRFRIPPEDAEDILQDVQLLMLYKWNNLHSPEHWLVGTTENRCIMYWRKRRKLPMMVGEEALDRSAEAPTQEATDVARDVGRALAHLTARSRTLLELRYGLGCEPGEVAERMGYSRASISKVTRRSLAALSGALRRVGYLATEESGRHE
jgi:RNA polymerase sigma factor (sigma-70 family)